jgi:ABC-type multidrug transport system fused ATPase/permease subunit
MPAALRTANALSIVGLLRPHWKAMTIALVAVAGESTAALLEPWPLKIVLDYLLQSRPLPGWMTPVVGWIGAGKLAVLNFAVLAVAVIAVVGAVSSYLNTYLTTNVGQWVMHDLRRTLYHHIHRLSLAEHDEKRTGDLRRERQSTDRTRHPRQTAGRRRVLSRSVQHPVRRTRDRVSGMTCARTRCGVGLRPSTLVLRFV